MPCKADVPAGRMNNVSDDGDTGQASGPPQVASIAAHRVGRRHAGPGPADPAPPMPADLAYLQAELTDLDATAPEIPPPPDGSDILRRLDHATAGNGVIARLGEVMARITADDPATAAFWASLAGYEPQQDDPKPSAPR
jgi:hypothetical protein